MSSRPVTQAPAPSPNVNPITHPCVKSLSPADDCVVHPGVESSQPSFSEAKAERKSEEDAKEDAKVVDSTDSSELPSSGVNDKGSFKEELEVKIVDEISDMNISYLSSTDPRRQSSSYTMSSGVDLNELSLREQVPAPSSDTNPASTPSSLAKVLYSGEQSSQITSNAADNDVSRKEEVAAITGTSDTTPPASEEQSTGAASAATAHSDHTNAADSGNSSTTPRARAPRRRSKTLSRGTIDPTALLDAPPAPITEITAEPGDVAETLTDNEKAVENKENDPFKAH